MTVYEMMNPEMAIKESFTKSIWYATSTGNLASVAIIHAEADDQYAAEKWLDLANQHSVLAQEHRHQWIKLCQTIEN